jgi:hypothetical protein
MINQTHSGQTQALSQLNKGLLQARHIQARLKSAFQPFKMTDNTQPTDRHVSGTNSSPIWFD